MSIIATGYNAQFGVYQESSFGTLPVGTLGSPLAYEWIGSVKEFNASVNRNPILIYRSDGSHRFPVFILPGQREVDITLTFYPQEVGSAGISTQRFLYQLFSDMVHNSFSFIMQFTDITQSAYVTGAKVASIQFTGRVSAAMEVTVTMQAKDITIGADFAALYVAFPSDPGTQYIPFYFTEHSFSYASSPWPRVLQFDVTLTNTISRVFQFNTDLVRDIVVLLGKAEGTVKVTFQDITELNQVLLPIATYQTPGSNALVALGLEGPSLTPRTLTVSTTRFSNTEIPTAPEDYIAMDFPFTGEGMTIA